MRNNYVEGAHINYLVGGVDVQGELVESGNTSVTPRQTDWDAARDGCAMGGEFDRWDPTDRIARDPTLAGWTDKRVHCER